MSNAASMPVSAHDRLRRLFESREQTGAGVHDGLSALLASKRRFDFLWASSFCSSAAMGLPDAGIIGAEQMLAGVREVRRCTDRPVVVDLDTGYGDPLKIYYVVQEMVRAGVNGLCIEDNPISKRCSLYEGCQRTLVSVEEHAARVRAARAAVADLGGSCAIVARTEAFLARLGLEEALRRASAYVEAGADAVFVQSVKPGGEEILEFCREWQRRTPVFLAPTRFPQLSKSEFFAAGASHVIFANHGLRAAHAAMDRIFRALADAESSAGIEAEISSVEQVSRDVGADEIAGLDFVRERPVESVRVPASSSRPD